MTFHQVFLRLAVAVGVGALIGLDRELRHKPAGLRTMALVSLGSAASRAIQGIVTGCGFLGTGAIIHNRRRSDRLDTVATSDLGGPK